MSIVGILCLESYPVNGRSPVTRSGLAPASKSDEVRLALAIQEIEKSSSESSVEQIKSSFEKLMAIPGWEEVLPRLFQSLYVSKKLSQKVEMALAQILIAENNLPKKPLTRELERMVWIRKPWYGVARELLAGAYQSGPSGDNRWRKRVSDYRLAELKPLIDKFGYKSFEFLNHRKCDKEQFVKNIIRVRKSYTGFDQYWPSIAQIASRNVYAANKFLTDMWLMHRRESGHGELLYDEQLIRLSPDEEAQYEAEVEDYLKPAKAKVSGGDFFSYDDYDDPYEHVLFTEWLDELTVMPGWKNALSLYFDKRPNAATLRAFAHKKKETRRELRSLFREMIRNDGPSAAIAHTLLAGGYVFNPNSKKERDAKDYVQSKEITITTREEWKVGEDDEDEIYEVAEEKEEIESWWESFRFLIEAFGYRPFQVLWEKGIFDREGVFYQELEALHSSDLVPLWPDIVRLCCLLGDTRSAVQFLRDIRELDEALFERGESLRECWEDVMQLCKNPASLRNRIVKCFIPMRRMLKQDLHRCIPGLAEMNRKAGDDGVLIMRYGLQPLARLIRGPEDIVKIGALLHALPDKQGRYKELLFRYALPSVKQLIKNRDDLAEILDYLGRLWSEAGDAAPYIFEFGLPAVREMIETRADLARLGKDLIDLATLAGDRKRDLFEGRVAYTDTGIGGGKAVRAPASAGAAVGATRIRPPSPFDHDFGPLRHHHNRQPFQPRSEFGAGPGQIRYFSMGFSLRLEPQLRPRIRVPKPQRYQETRADGLPEIRRYFEKDLRRSWPAFMAACRASGSGAVDLVNKGLPALHDLFGNDLPLLWPGLVRLGEKAGADAGSFYADGLTRLFAHVPYALRKQLILNDQLTDLLYDFIKRSGRNVEQNARLLAATDPKDFKQRLQAMNTLLDLFDTDIVLGPFLDKFVNAPPAQLKEWADAKNNWTFNLDDPMHLYLNYMVYNDSFSKSDEGRQVSLDEFVKLVGELKQQKYVEVPEEHNVELRGLAYEAYLVWKKIKEIEERAEELGRPVVVVGNLATGKISASPFVVRKNGRDTVYGTDIPVIYAKVGSTPCHNDELYLEDNLFDKETMKDLCANKPIVIVLDASTSVSNPDRTSPHIPDAFKGYRNYFLGINVAQKKLLWAEESDDNEVEDEDENEEEKPPKKVIQAKDFYVDDDFVEEFSHSGRYLSLKEKIDSLGISENEVDAAPYRMRVWHPCEKDLWMRVGKAKNMVAPKLKDVGKEITGPTMVFIETAIEPEAVPDGIRTGFIKGDHSSGFFDDTHDMQRFYWGYMPGRGVVRTDIYDLAARTYFYQLAGVTQPSQTAKSQKQQTGLCPISTVAVDLDGTIAETDKPLDQPMLGTIISLLSQNTRVMVLTEDIEEHLGSRIIDLIPANLRKNLVIFSEGGPKGIAFDVQGRKKYIEEFNDAGVIDKPLREKIEGVLTNNFAGEFQFDDRPDRISPEYRIDLRNISGSRDEFIRRLNPLLQKAGIYAKAYAVGSTSVKILLQSKDDALMFMVDNEDVDPEELLVIGNDARANRWDSDMLTAFPGAINVNVGKREATIEDVNPNIVQTEEGISGVETLLEMIADEGGIRIDELRPYLADLKGTGGDDHILRTGVRQTALADDEKAPKSFAGETDSAELRDLMGARFADNQYGLLNDPAAKTAAGNLQKDAIWAATQVFFDEVLKNNVKPEFRNGIKDKLRIVAMNDFPIAGHHGTGGKGVGINSAYIDWNTLRAMAENKEAYAAYFASWLEHEYRERCLGEAHDALAMADPLYKDTFAFIKTILHGNLKSKFTALFEKDTTLKPFYYFLNEPALVKERKEILAFSSDLFAEGQAFAEFEVILAELKLGGSDKEVWIRITDPAQLAKFKEMEKSYPFLKVLDQNAYLTQLQKAKEKVIKSAFADDKTMGDLDIAVPKPGAGQAVNAFSIFLAALSKDENIIKTVDKATMAEMLRYIEQTNYNAPVKADYRSRMQDYKNSAIALISA